MLETQYVLQNIAIDPPNYYIRQDDYVMAESPFQAKIMPLKQAKRAAKAIKTKTLKLYEHCRNTNQLQRIKPFELAIVPVVLEIGVGELPSQLEKQTYLVKVTGQFFILREDLEKGIPRENRERVIGHMFNRAYPQRTVFGGEEYTVPIYVTSLRTIKSGDIANLFRNNTSDCTVISCTSKNRIDDAIQAFYEKQNNNQLTFTTTEILAYRYSGSTNQTRVEVPAYTIPVHKSTYEFKVLPFK